MLIPTATTGDPVGISDIERRESNPPKEENLELSALLVCLSLYTIIGTPITGIIVCDAIIPGRCAAPPAPAIIILNPIFSACLPYSSNLVGVLCADTI